MRTCVLTLLILAGTAAAQVAIPVTLTRNGYVLQPAISANGRTVVLGSNVAPDGSEIRPGADAYLYVQGVTSNSLRRLTSVSGDASVTAVSVAPDGGRVAYTLYSSSSPVEEVHVVGGAPPVDTKVAADTLSCIKPLVVCANCIFACLDAPHVSPDGKQVLYAAKRSQPFYVAAADGSGVSRLPVFSGFLAEAPWRVISDSGTVVFTSSAPNGPTVAAAATDVYRMKLDGTGVGQVTRFGTDANIYARNATISADGSLIAFESNYDPAAKIAGAVLRVFAVAPDGAGLRQISDGASDAMNPSPTADGGAIAYLQGGSIQIRRTAAPDTSVRPIDYPGSLVQDPVLSEDSSRVAFTLAAPGGPRVAVVAVDTASRAETPVFTPAFIQPGGVVSAAGIGVAPSPGSLISVYGANFTYMAGITGAGSFPLPLQLGGLSLLAGGRPLPLAGVSSWQINAELAPDMGGTPVDFQVKLLQPALGSNLVTAQPQASAPAFFGWLTTQLPGQGSYWQAAALHTGTGVPADAAHPAAAGETLEFYGAGFGPTTPVVAAGEVSPSDPPAQVATLPEVRLCGTLAQVPFAGLAPGYAGVYQINVTVPAGLKVGLCGVQVRLGASADSSSQIAVR